MPDFRFPAPGTDTQFPAPGTDTRFPDPGVDDRFDTLGLDGRFDGDIVLPVVSVVLLPSIVTEGASFTIRFNVDTVSVADIPVTYTIAASSTLPATSADIAFGTFNTTIFGGTSFRDVVVPTLVDSTVDGAKRADITITNVTNAVISGSPTAILNILDADSAPVVQIASVTGGVEGSGTGPAGTLRWTLSRSGSTGGSTTVTYSVAAGASGNPAAAGGAGVSVPPLVQDILGPLVDLSSIQTLGTQYANYKNNFFAYIENHQTLDVLNTGDPTNDWIVNNYYDRARQYYAWSYALTNSNPSLSATYRARADALVNFYYYGNNGTNGFLYNNNPQIYNYMMPGTIIYAILNNDNTIKQSLGQTMDLWRLAYYWNSLGGAGDPNNDPRVDSRILLNLMLCVKLGITSPGRYGTTHDYVADLQTCFNNILAGQNANGAFDYPQQGNIVKPFMCALLHDELIRFYDWFATAGQKTQIYNSIKASCDYIWNTCWDVTSQSIMYLEADYGGEFRIPAPDLNMLMAPAYAWLYSKGAGATYLSRYNSLFAGGVANAALDFYAIGAGGKIWNENYSASYVGIHYATGAPLIWEAVGGDLTLGFGTGRSVTFNPGETSKNIDLEITKDYLVEGPETVRVTLTGITGGTLGATTALDNIITDDDIPPVIQIGAFADVSEGSAASPGTLSLVIARSGNVNAGTSTVNYALSAGPSPSATGADFASGNFASGIATFNPGDTTVTINFPLVGNAAVNTNRNVRATLSAPVGATLGALIQDDATINDDDIPGALVSDQVIDFGALTPANTGGAQAALNDGTFVNFTSINTALGSGDRSGWALSSGRLVRTTGTPVSSNGAVFPAVVSGVTINVTINVINNCWSFANITEMRAIATQSVATKEGRSARARPGLYRLGETTAIRDDIFSNRNYSTGFTWSSHGNRDNTTFRLREKWGDPVLDAGVNVPVVFDGGSNETWERVTFEVVNDYFRDFTTGAAKTSPGYNNNSSMVYMAGCTNMTFRQLRLKSDYAQVKYGASFEWGFGPSNFSVGGANGLTLDDVKIEGVTRSFYMGGSKGTATGCEVSFYEGDGALINGQNITVENSFWHSLDTDTENIGAYGDALTMCSAALTGAGLATTGTIHYRGQISIGSGTTDQILFGMGPTAGGTAGERVALYVKGPSAGVNPNSIEFVGKSAAGNTVLIINSGTLPQFSMANVLIDIDTAGNSYMHVWLWGGRAGRDPTTILVGPVAAQAGQVGVAIDFTQPRSYVFSRWAGALNTRPTAPWNGTASRLALWLGAKANIQTLANRQQFYDDANVGYGKKRVTQSSTYMTGLGATSIFDLSNGKDNWINGKTPDLRGNPFVQITGFTTFSDAASFNSKYDIFHADAIQAVVNGPTKAYSDLTQPIGYKIRNNVIYGGRLDGLPPTGGAQGIFMEDVRVHNSFENIDVSGNLIVAATNNGIYVTNPSGSARVIHNSLATLKEILNRTDKTGNAAPSSELEDPYIYSQVHNPQGAARVFQISGLAGPNFPFETGFLVATADLTRGGAIEFTSGSGSTRTVGIQRPTTSGSTPMFFAGETVAKATYSAGVFAVDTNNPWSGTVVADAVWQREAQDNYAILMAANIARSHTTDPFSFNGNTVNVIKRGGNVNRPYASQTDIGVQNATLFAGTGVTNWDNVVPLLTSKAAIQSVFATNPALRAPYEVRVGWDAYVGVASPYDANPNSFSVPAITNAVVSSTPVSASILVAGLATYPASGSEAAVFASSEDYATEIEVRLLASDGITVLRDWSTKHIAARNGQFVQVRRQADTNAAGGVTRNTRVFIGNKTAVWAVTTAVPLVLWDETFVVNPGAQWTGSQTWSSTGDPTPGAPDTAELAVGVGSNPTMRMVSPSPQLKNGKTYRITYWHRRPSGGSNTQTDTTIGTSAQSSPSVANGGANIWGRGGGLTQTAPGNTQEGRKSISSVNAVAVQLPDFVMTLPTSGVHFWFQARGTTAAGALTRIQIIELDPDTAGGDGTQLDFSQPNNSGHILTLGL